MTKELPPAELGLALLGLTDAPRPGLRRQLLAPADDDTPPAPKPGARVLASTDPELLAAAAAALSAKPAAAKAPPAPPAPEPPTKTDREIRAEQRESLAEIKKDLADLARARGVDLTKPAPDPARADAQRKADLRKTMLDQAITAAASKRDDKARRRAAKALRRLGL